MKKKKIKKKHNIQYLFCEISMNVEIKTSVNVNLDAKLDVEHRSF